MNGKLFNTAKIKSASTKGHKELFVASLTSKGASPALTHRLLCLPFTFFPTILQYCENKFYLNKENNLRYIPSGTKHISYTSS